jgi:transglutaminase-like putative cysteine protease
MGRYRVVHRTEYRYGRTVSAEHTVARLLPRALPHQQVRSAEIVVEPEPASRRDHVDGFGNHVTDLVLDEPHDYLVVTACSDVELTGPDGDPSVTGWRAPWEQAAAATAEATSDDGLLARTCSLDSPLVERAPELAAFATRAFTPGRPLGEVAAALTRHIFESFEFVPGATDVSTPVLQVLDDRHGVCQDFAHLLLGALRSLGLGARYVSGYVETEPPPGQPRLVGADASHAWVGLYVPGGADDTGETDDDGSDETWIDLDPTNGQVHPGRHVTIGWGRDFTDVTPLRGVFYGPPTDQQLTISVDVSRTG